MKALITGGKGFVGPHLKTYLETQGFEVIAVDKEDFDILDKDSVFKFISENNFDHIYHLAGFSSPRLSFEKPQLCHDVNVIGTKNLLDAVVESNSKPKILIVSSAHVYGEPKYLPIDEHHNTDPTTSPYAKSRIDQEKLTQKYQLPIIVSRSFNHTGPGRQPIFICSEFAKKIAEIEKGIRSLIIEVFDLKTERDFTDVRDMVKAYYIALEKADIGEIYNICSGKSYSAQNILDILLSFTDKEIQIKETPKEHKRSVPVLVGDNSKFIQKTGWKQEIPFEQTLKDLLNYWRQRV